MCDDGPDMYETAMRALFYSAIEHGVNPGDLVDKAKTQLLGNGPARDHGDHSVISDACEELDELLTEVEDDNND